MCTEDSNCTSPKGWGSSNPVGAILLSYSNAKHQRINMRIATSGFELANVSERSSNLKSHWLFMGWKTSQGFSDPVRAIT